MSDIYPVPENFKQRAHLDPAGYEKAYRESVEDTEGFWAETAKRIDWFKFPTLIKDVSFDKADLHIKWYEDGVLNACYNCIDRHLETRGDQTAIIWEGEPGDTRVLRYQDLHREVCKFANGLKSIGAKKGDRITIYIDRKSVV